MNRLILTHLTFVGTDVPAATVAFGPGLTVVRGPSDTGKSFIVKAIDFMLGGGINPKQIPEMKGYATALLGLQLPTNQPITLSRSVNGGALGIYDGDLRAVPTGPPPRSLAGKQTTTPNNISSFLLEQIGLANKRVRKNAQNQTQALSFRNIAHLCVVHETKMQSETTPALSGHRQSATAELSTLKLIIQGDDDSDLIAVASTKDRSRIVNAKSEIIDALLADLEEKLRDISPPDDLHAQLGRLNDTVGRQNTAIAKQVEQRGTTAARLSRIHEKLLQAQQRAGDIQALLARFQLLADKYDSDLGRLEMIGEAGTFLGFFNPGRCVFCGAEPRHQHHNGHVAQDVTLFGQSISTESAKTEALRDDLLKTLADLREERSELDRHLKQLTDSVRTLRSRIAELDRVISPQQVDVASLLAKRSTLERQLADYEQIDKLNLLKTSIAIDGQAETVATAAGFDQRTITQFSQSISTRLSAWGFPGGDQARYDMNDQDIIAKDQPRSAHGKGVRAILHSAFSIGLARFCVDRDTPHPGFVVLDSPLVTYRAPDVDKPGLEEALPPDFAARFYDDIQRQSGMQIIVMENTDPPDGLARDSVDVRFTGTTAFGRFGFFTPRVDT